MKSLVSAFLVLLWVSAGSAAEPAAEEILRKSQEAYVALRSYVGTTTVKSKTVISAATMTQTASAKITFVRPGRIRVEGKDVQGQPYTIVSDGAQTWLAWAFQNEGRFQKAESLEMAVSAMTGVAAQAPTAIPAALIPLRWGYPWVPTAPAQLVGREAVAGVSCYKVVVKSSPGSQLTGTRTFWVDPTSFLLRQLSEEQNEQDLAQMQSRMQQMMEERAAKGSEADKQQLETIRGMLKTAAMKSREIVQSFTIERVNAAVDGKLFRNPILPSGR
ncbi:MAG TPA: hypothetical protein VFN71_03795 [Methylomirabilota bacterium]|nr:hypothetical protein [Methylomirabilota bacterium]